MLVFRAHNFPKKGLRLIIIKIAYEFFLFFISFIFFSNSKILFSLNFQSVDGKYSKIMKKFKKSAYLMRYINISPKFESSVISSREFGRERGKSANSYVRMA